MPSTTTSAARHEARYDQALLRFERVRTALQDLGVSVELIGSLAHGGFHETSDVDILVRDCPPQLKYRIESLVEDILEEIPFDVLYLDEIPTPRLKQFIRSELLQSSRRAWGRP